MTVKATINLTPPPRWGKIKGILTDQPDLKAALDAIHTEIDEQRDELTVLNNALNDSTDFVGLINATMEI
ncbi:hypothetical protein [Alkanindiges illinoisensis]|uniref:hypothetical protein n=1 Tax=Alkanindiges illinoisensis TaxID=197183 RepID=UPI00047A62B5|nr:hypothetical protein [Alkanindiges illinoisensis]